MAEDSDRPTVDTTHVWYQRVIVELQLAAGDYMELLVGQDSGGAKSVASANDPRNFFTASLIGSGKTVTPFAKCYRTTVQTITTATWTAVVFDTANSVELTDNDAIHDPVTNPSRFTCRTPGVYALSAAVDWVANATGVRYVEFRKNGAALAELADTSRIGTVTAGGNRLALQALLELAVGDYVELYIQQSSGGNLDATIGTSFAVVKVGAPNAGGTGIGPAQADVYTLATLPAASTVPDGRIVGVSNGAGGQQARMAMAGAWLNLG